MDFLEELELNDLDEEQRDLAETVGLNNYRNLIRTYGGVSIYLPLEATVCRKLRNKKMRKLFNGDYKKLAREFKLSIGQTRDIIDNKS